MERRLNLIAAICRCAGLFVLILLGPGLQAQPPAPTSFAYQAYVTKAFGAVNELTDFRFSLWEDQFAGAQIGTTLQLDAIDVVNGLASVELDFGVAAFSSGEARWLQIEIATPSGSTVFETLMPRRFLTAVPYAAFALSGNEGPAGPQGDTGPAGAQGATGADGPSGPPGVQGPAGPQGPQGNTGATGPAGPAGAQGPTGAPGANGVLMMERFSGFAGSIAASQTAYAFVGPTASVTLTSPARLFGAGEAPLATTSGVATFVRFGLCYQLGSGALFQFAPNLDYSLIEVDTTRTSVSAAMATGQLAAGTYNVGLCVRNEGTVVIDDNDYVNGWVAVTQ